MTASGFLNLLKPPGMTSHDVVAWVRAQLGIRRIGHLGTLDPAAAGVLPLSLGLATRLFQFAGGADKAYRAEIAFGVRTDTLDAEGRVVGLADAGDLTENDLRRLLQGLLGEVTQVPPAFSAASVGGQRLHRRARAGLPAAGRPKRVRIMRAELVDFHPGPRARALVDLTCSAGTYVRTIADDLGQAAGCGAHLGFLVRTLAGRFSLDDALTLEELEVCVQQGEWQQSMLPIDWPIDHLREVALSERQAGSFVRGARVLAGAAPAWPVRAYAPGRVFLGLGEVLSGGALRPRIVLRSEEGGEP